ncbi:unnamed protein product, partial [Heterosigma akashiwo]
GIYPAGQYYDDEGIDSRKNLLPIHGNSTTFNFNALLAQTIQSSDYFRQLVTLNTYHELVDEIYNKVGTVEPWSTGTSRVPSSAFCLLFKLCMFQLTERQMHSILNHP